MTDPTANQRALATIQRLRRALERQVRAEPVAVVGLACRFPQAPDPPAFWRLLAAGGEAVTTLPEARRRLLEGHDEARLLDPAHPYWGAYLDDVERFDARAFGITAREALFMDPQQRLLLEVAWEAIEDTGRPAAHLRGSRTGVYVGMYASQYLRFARPDADLDALYVATGNATSIAANRVSYLLDLRGPSLVVDTACSSSLVALQLAVQHLQARQCDQCLVAGASLNLLPSVNLLLARARMLAPDGRCKTFDAGADGYVQGEGVGAVLLKPLAHALRDGDRVYAVILGALTNQDGRSNGLTAPNGDRQEALLRGACAASGVDPAHLAYVECHGTGTYLGDPIEVEALGRVVGARDAAAPCWIGSVKTNLGHLEPAAGVAGLIKVCLALEHGAIPPHRNLAAPNPHIPFARYHLRVPARLEPWPAYGGDRLAGVSSFGFGGTNAHALLRGPRPDERHAIPAPPRRAWARERFWPAPPRAEAAPRAPAGAPLPCRRVASPLDAKQFAFEADEARLPELRDTRGVLHVGFYLEMLAAALRALTGASALTARDVEFLAPATVPPGGSLELQLILRPGPADGAFAFGVHSRPADEAAPWTLHARGHVGTGAPADVAAEPLAALLARCAARAGDAEDFAARLRAMHMPVGPTIRWTEAFWQGADEVVCRFRAPRPEERAGAFAAGLHPGAIDGAIQPLFLLLEGAAALPHLTSRIGALAWAAPRDAPLYLVARRRGGGADGRTLVGDWHLRTEAGETVASCSDLELTRVVSPELLARAAAAPLDAADWSSGTTEERARRVADFVRAQAAAIFQMAPDDVPLDTPLQDAGMDSLMALALGQRIEQGLGVRYPARELLQPVSVAQIARRLAGDAAPPDGAARNPWIAYRSRARAPRLRLLCFPHGGAGASVYRGWQPLLPEDVEVCPVQLPGREGRAAEAPLTDLAALVAALLEALGEELGAPFALFGHSAGALVAYALAAALRARGRPLPAHLFVAAFPAPHLRSAGFEALLRDLAALPAVALDPSRLDGADLARAAALLQQHRLLDADDPAAAPALLRVTLPTLLADGRLVAGYRGGEGGPLPVPITAFAGTGDRWVEPATMEPWRRHTSRAFSLRPVAGGHLFLRDEAARREVLAEIARSLAAQDPQGAAEAVGA